MSERTFGRVQRYAKAWTLDELTEMVRAPASLPDSPAVVAILRDLIAELRETRDLLAAQTTIARGRADEITKLVKQRDGIIERLHVLLAMVNLQLEEGTVDHAPGDDAVVDAAESETQHLGGGA